ncbi:hypothetical protein CLAC_03285 [Corynebacterium lactis RW2-5]|uniref:Uncharacterized protein n=1 Tax=Corynebacterium lactis RW2-5 TaxID=1408189 RepID=A0A0K2H3B2_9CORY|nr:hypothetical protein CLAC_03285 [Corynebacterium lactis RW2-5]
MKINLDNVDVEVVGDELIVCDKAGGRVKVSVDEVPMLWNALQLAHRHMSHH